MSNRISLVSPDLAPLDELAPKLLSALSSGQLTNAREVEAFEREAAELLHVDHVVAVSSCTSGLMLVERCLALRGEVVTPSFTFFGGAHGLLWNGLTPVLADCDLETLQIDPASVRRLITPSTGAILATHIFGCPAPIDELEEIAAAHRIPLIFDAAHGLGARWRGRDVASRGDASVYSLSPTKQITTGEGGLIATRHGDLAHALRQARNYGKGAGYDCEVLGLNARMTELQGVLGRAALPRLAEAVRRRNEIAEQYQAQLLGTPGVRFQRIPSQAYSSRKDFAVLLEHGIDRDRLMRELGEAGIETRAYFDPPLHRQRLYRRFHRPSIEPLTATDSVSAQIVCLPIHTGLAAAQVRRVATEVRRFCESSLASVSAEAQPRPVWSPVGAVPGD